MPNCSRNFARTGMHTSHHPEDSSNASLSRSLSTHNGTTACAPETIDELLQRVLRMQADYADHPVHSYEEFVRLIHDWYGLITSPTVLPLPMFVALADLHIVCTR
jgi:hypothetical protein